MKYLGMFAVLIIAASVAKLGAPGEYVRLLAVIPAYFAAKDMHTYWGLRECGLNGDMSYSRKEYAVHLVGWFLTALMTGVLSMPVLWK